MAKTPSNAVTPVRELKDLTRLIQRAPGFPESLAALKNGHSATIDGTWGSAGPLACAALGLHAPAMLVIVVAHVGDVDDFRDDVSTFAGITPEIFPAWERLPREAAASASDEVFGRRLRVVKRLGTPLCPKILVTPLQALLQPVPTRESLLKTSKTIRVGEEVPIELLASWLVGHGLTRAEVVEVAGEFSVRGGIVDLFPPSRFASNSSATRSSRSAPSTRKPSAPATAGTTSPSRASPRSTTPRKSATSPTLSRQEPGSRSLRRSTSARKGGSILPESTTNAGFTPSRAPSPSSSSFPR